MPSSRLNCARHRAGASCSANPAAIPLTGRATSTPTPSSPKPPARSSDRVGRSGLVLPTGIATDATTGTVLRRPCPQRQARVIPGISRTRHSCSAMRSTIGFASPCLPSAVARSRVNLASFAFGTRYMHRICPTRQFTMPPEEILLVNPNTGTTPAVPFPPRRRDHDRHLQASPRPLARRTLKRIRGAFVHAGYVQHGQRLRPLPHP